METMGNHREQYIENDPVEKYDKDSHLFHCWLPIFLTKDKIT